MPHIRHEVLIGATAQKVYDAITTQRGLSAWWTPAATGKPELDTIVRFPFGPEYFKEMRITRLKPFSEVRWICIKGAREWIETSISFELLSGNSETMLTARPELSDQIQQLGDFTEATLLIFQHDEWKEYTPMFSECNYTWAQFLRSLKLFCETGKGRPWPNQHRTE